MARSTFSGPVKSTGGLICGSDGTTVTKIYKGTVAVNPASIGDNDIGTTTVTITGAVVGDIVLMCPPTAGLTAGLMAGVAYVSAADTVKLSIANCSGGAVDEASATWSYILIRS
jgi:hypothetical protein